MNSRPLGALRDEEWAVISTVLEEERQRGQVPPHPVWHQMLNWSRDRLTQTDPAIQNLEVAKGIPALANLDVRNYCEKLDQASAAFSRWLPEAEREFCANPQGWGNDLTEFRLGMLCQFIEQVMGVRYNEDQRDVQKISYINPGDLFLNGVLDTGRGTCGSMAVLYYAICWRLCWPVSLAMSWWHSICRYDDGKRTINIETSCIGRGGFSTPPDAQYMAEDNLRKEDITSGANLTALKPRQVLGCFFGARGRYWYDRYDAKGAEADYRRAKTLFPDSRLWREKWENAFGLVRSGLPAPTSRC